MDLTLSESEPLEVFFAYCRFWVAMAYTVVATVVMFSLTLFGLLKGYAAGGVRSPLEPMIAAPGKQE